MLILTRRIGETIVIGNEITINVLSVKGNQVRIGIDAPRDFAVHCQPRDNQIRRTRGDGHHCSTTMSGPDGVIQVHQ